MTDKPNVSMVQALSKMNIQVIVELGRVTKTQMQLLGCGEGSIIELDKLAGEPVDVFANNVLFAKGEVVVIDENFAVRVTEIVAEDKGAKDSILPYTKTPEVKEENSKENIDDEGSKDDKSE